MRKREQVAVNSAACARAVSLDCDGWDRGKRKGQLCRAEVWSVGDCALQSMEVILTQLICECEHSWTEFDVLAPMMLRRSLGLRSKMVESSLHSMLRNEPVSKIHNVRTTTKRRSWRCWEVLGAGAVLAEGVATCAHECAQSSHSAV